MVFSIVCNIVLESRSEKSSNQQEKKKVEESAKTLLEEASEIRSRLEVMIRK